MSSQRRGPLSSAKLSTLMYIIRFFFSATFYFYDIEELPRKRMSTSSVSFLLVLFFLDAFIFVGCVRFEVGGEEGWVFPKSRTDEDMYNQWASKNRFKIGDTIHFKYQKDSVLVVTEEEYEKCRSSHPMFFSNNGDTTFELDRPGLFYFISGVSGHCERGQRMVIKVLDIEPPSPSGDQNSTAAETAAPSSAVSVHMLPFGIWPALIRLGLLFKFLMF